MAKKDSATSIKDLLAAQPKVRIMVPNTPGVAPEYDFKEVIVNGYTTRIKCGEYVDVPQTIADILSKSNATIAKSRKAFEDLTNGAGVNLTKHPDNEPGKEQK